MSLHVNFHIIPKPFRIIVNISTCSTLVLKTQRVVFESENKNDHLGIINTAFKLEECMSGHS